MAKYRKLSRTSSQRKALLRGQVTALLNNGKIVTTEAKAKEIQLVYEAVKKADPDEKLVQLKSLEALKDIANGEANKVFIPFEATSTLSSLGAIKEVMKDDKKDKKND